MLDGFIRHLYLFWIFGDDVYAFAVNSSFEELVVEAVKIAETLRLTYAAPVK